MQGMSNSIYSEDTKTGKSRGKILTMKKDALLRVDALSEVLNTTAKRIWEYAELALEEYRSSQLLGELLQKEGFSVEFGAGGLPTAFVATYGAGKPVIGILGEYDALPGISQKAGIMVQDPVKEYSPGHGCGHNLLGVGGAGAALAVKSVMEKYRLAGTVKFFGCPAEETIEGKTFMAREGVFSGLDICFDWHPSDETQVSLDSNQALNSFEVEFRGKTAHAAGDPWHGRSALDAIELMDIGINFLREHVPPSVRLHYVILDGGEAPNVVPAYARAWYYVRGKDRLEVDEIYAQVLKIAQGAALMTGTTHEIHFKTGVYNYLKNRTVAELLYRNLQWIKAPVYTNEEKVLACRLQKELGVKELGLSETVKALTEPSENISGGSSDVADVSWVVPTASLGVTCFPMEIPGHHWGIVSCAGSAIGFKGMLTAAKVISVSALEALTNGRIIAQAQKEFKEKTKDFVYRSAIPAGQKLPVKKKGT
jgi:aminobenzoyl-glutamate utilization protein B